MVHVSYDNLLCFQGWCSIPACLCSHLSSPPSASDRQFLKSCHVLSRRWAFACALDNVPLLNCSSLISPLPLALYHPTTSAQQALSPGTHPFILHTYPHQMRSTFVSSDLHSEIHLMCGLCSQDDGWNKNQATITHQNRKKWKTSTYQVLERSWDHWGPHSMQVGMWPGTTLEENNRQCLLMLRSTSDKQFMLELYPTEMCTDQNTCIRMFTATLSVTARNWNYPTPINIFFSIMVCSHRISYSTRMNEIWLHVMT